MSASVILFLSVSRWNYELYEFSFHSGLGVQSLSLVVYG